VLEIRALEPNDAAALSTMLRSQRSEYVRYFTPFPFDETTLTKILTAKVRDVFLGLYWDNKLAAFLMLRGWDEGYDVPAFGVVVAEEFAGQGLGALTLELAKVVSRLQGSSRLMLKVNPDHTSARALYSRAGFQETGLDSRTADITMHLTLRQQIETEP
jgi:RimJ/RimL family protein N-acetyltransferase